MNNSISKYIQKFEKRIFFDIVADGCGSGCIYCFTKHPTLEQILLSRDVINNICDEIIKLPDCNETIISLCPNTEPLKSEKSRELIELIVKRLSMKVKYIQIATKEKIPLQFLNFLNKNARFAGQIRISISLPYLQNVDVIEPYAANIFDRIDNFNRIRKFPNLVSILYLRPFNQQMLINKEIYGNLILEYCPDDICIGAELVPRVDGEQFCTYMYDNRLAPGIFEKVEKEKIFEFAGYLRKKAHCKIFYSSICNIANCSNYGCVLNLQQYDMRYCEDCALHV